MSRFLVKLDENLSRLHAAFLRERGYEADSVHDEGLSGASDELVWSRVLIEGRFLITLDLDFSDISGNLRPQANLVVETDPRRNPAQ